MKYLKTKKLYVWEDTSESTAKINNPWPNAQTNAPCNVHLVWLSFMVVVIDEIYGFPRKHRYRQGQTDTQARQQARETEKTHL